MSWITNDVIEDCEVIVWLLNVVLPGMQPIAHIVSQPTLISGPDWVYPRRRAESLDARTRQDLLVSAVECGFVGIIDGKVGKSPSCVSRSILEPAQAIKVCASGDFAEKTAFLTDPGFGELCRLFQPNWKRAHEASVHTRRDDGLTELVVIYFEDVTLATARRWLHFLFSLESPCVFEEEAAAVYDWHITHGVRIPEGRMIRATGITLGSIMGSRQLPDPDYYLDGMKRAAREWGRLSDLEWPE